MNKTKKKVAKDTKDDTKMERRPLRAGKGDLRVLWDSYRRGTYVKAKHGALV